MTPLPRSPLAMLLLGLACQGSIAAPGPGLFDVRDSGAAGDGHTPDTLAIQRALDACAAAGGGEVLIPPGRYLSGTLRLRSHNTVTLAGGARLIGTTNLSEYTQPAIPADMPEAKWGKWHRALLIAEGAEDITLGGAGTIDGNRVFDPTGEERMRGPHTLLFVGCRGFTIRDLSIVDSANYALFFQASDRVEIRNVKITGGWDGVHFRGAPDRWCHDVRIIDCQFQTGDDSIAGRYWENTLISGCVINSSCNGIRVIGPATRLTIDHCLFRGPGEQPHRSSSRTNMLSGVILQPGAWDETRGLLDEVLLSNNTMQGVASPVTLWTKPGNPVGRVTVSGLEATGVYRAAFSAESWSDAPITNVVLRNIHAEFTGGGSPASAAGNRARGPGLDCRPLAAWGLSARRVEQLTLEDVHLSLATPDSRPAIELEEVTRATLNGVRHAGAEGGTNGLSLRQVGSLVIDGRKAAAGREKIE